MYKNSPIQLHVRQAASNLGEKIKSCHYALEELRRLSLVIFTNTAASPTDIQNWFEKDGFGIDPDGFWTPLPLLQAFREKRAPPDAISFSWHPGLAKHPEACFRMYCLRHTGPYLDQILGKLPDAAWMYYQDVTNTSIQFPYIDQVTAITADFDWSTYHTYISVAPENNPHRKIRWTSPTIDYAGEGLIVSASIPVYLSHRFVGLWSIDLPMKSLYKELLIEPHLKSQVNFIMDKDGFLVTHPLVETQIDKEKGSIYRGHVHDLGKMFGRLDPRRLLDEKSGQFMLSDDTSDETVVWFEVIPGIRWIFLATLPRKSMEDAVNQRIREALDRVKFGDLSHRIKEVSDVDQARMVAEGFNEMVAALERQEKDRKRSLREKKELEKRLQQSQRMEAIGTLAGGIAHDFNNILFPILGYAELLFTDLPQESKAFEMVSEIYRAAVRAKELTQQILTFSRHTELENQVIFYQDIIKESLKLLRASIPRNIDILTNIDPDCPPVLGDPTRLHQILMNLCTNAFHALEENGGVFEISLKSVALSSPPPGLESLALGTFVRLIVSDNGHGMDDETLSKIFDPYFTTKTENKGTGLGLSITYGIVRKLDGDIKVYSEPGKGSAFHVYLPATDSGGRTKKQIDPVVAGGKERILLVDDESRIVNMEKRLLEKLGYTVSGFTDSPKALEMFSQAPSAFDLVITDMTMPKLTGDVLAQKIKAIRKDIPVILCTGFSEKISSGDSMYSCVDGFFLKPVSIVDINQAIRRIMDSPGQKLKR